MSTKIITIKRQVKLHPSLLDGNIKGHLLDIFKEGIKNDCSKEHGHILEYIQIVEILDNIISSAKSEIIFTVLVEVKTLKPIIGDTCEGKVCMICENGIFIEVENILKILIPITSISDYELKNTILTNGKKNIQENDTIKVKISGFKYSNKTFCCYGELIDV